MASLFSVSLFAKTIHIEKLSQVPEGVDSNSLYLLLQETAREHGLKLVEAADQAEEIFRVKVMKLGETYIVSAQKMKNDTILHSTKLKARQAEELDEVLSRVFRALNRNVAAKDDALISDLTEDEVTIGSRRKLSRDGATFGAGLSVMNNLGVEDIGWYFYFGKAWAAGPIYLGYRFNFGFDNIKSNMNPTDRNWAWFSDLSLSVSSYLSQSDTSPFIMGEFGYSLARHALLQSTSGGMLTAIGAGVGLFRTYDIHVQVGLRFSAIFQTVFSQTPYPLESHPKKQFNFS
ncbi:MAG: hypothetical protein EBQ85_09060 [Proteobacteria bacterium]|nr:hypothetical protein [Pseudomonadota bacterium]